MSFLTWIWARSRNAAPGAGTHTTTASPVGSRADVPQEYASLHKYLDDRHASLVFLTLEQIESLLGFALPDVARTEEAWWTGAGRQTAAWVNARRIATPNLLARNVAFERLP